MAILYGEGDFMKTVGIAVSVGYDCDNQSAACGGLKGDSDGPHAGLPARGRWNKPFNDNYITYSRDGLPIHNRIFDIVGRIANIAEAAILREGGKKIGKDGQIIYVFPGGKGDRSDLNYPRSQLSLNLPASHDKNPHPLRALRPPPLGRSSQ